MIRRPLYYVALAFAAAILFKYYFGWKVAGALAALLALWWMRSRKAQGRTAAHGITATQGMTAALALLLLLSFMAGLATLAVTDMKLAKDPALKYLGQETCVVGLVKEPSLNVNSRGEQVIRMQLEVKAFGDDELQRGKESVIQVTVPVKALKETQLNEAPLKAVPPGTVIRVTGKIKEPDPKRNPNCFDYRFYLKTCGIQAVMWSEKMEYALRGETSVQPFRAALFLFRENYLQRVAEHTDSETAAFLRAMLFGEKGMLEEDTQEVFQKNGTAHVLAVSGLHVGMLYGAMVLLWDLAAGILPGVFGQKKGKRFFIVTAVFFSGYTFLAGYAPSVVRAVLMILLHAFAKMTGRRYDLNCAAFAVGLASLARNPYIMFQAGFQMSFLAILTIGLLTPYIQRIYTGALASSIAVQIGLLPYMMAQFNVLPMLGILINIPVIFVTGLVVPAGMAGMMLPSGSAEASLSRLLQIPAGVWDEGMACLCKGLVKMNELACIDHVTCFTVTSPPQWVLALWYSGMLLLASEEGRLLFLEHRSRPIRRLIRGLIIGVLIASIALGQSADDGFRHMDLVFVDIGQGDCMHIRSGGRNYLIDGGGSTEFEVGTKTLKPYLLKNSVRTVDGAFITHLHTDHYKGICELAKAGFIRRLYIYESNQLKIDQVSSDTGLPKDRIRFLRAGHRVQLSKDDSLTVLWPKAQSTERYREMILNEEDENASSLIMRVSISGVTVLATGDLGEEGEQELLREYGGETLHADILKVGHHGSKTSSSEEFLDAVGPAFAVIQVGENNPLLAKEYDIVSKKLRPRSIFTN